MPGFARGNNTHNMKERLIFIARYFFSLVALSTVYRVLFLAVNGADEGYTPADFLDVAWHGMRLDLAVAGYFTALPLLLTTVSIFIRIPLRRFYIVYNSIIALATALAFLADISLYPFWEFKLDASFLIYIDSPANAFASISAWHLALLVILLATATTGIFWLLSAITRHEFNSCRKKATPLLLHIAICGLIFLGIRGGVTESTNNIGTVFYSEKQILNHSAINPIFSFLYSIGKMENYNHEYAFFDDSEAEDIFSGLYMQDNCIGDTLLNKNRPNIVIVLLEGMSATFIEKLGGMRGVTPSIEQLANEGVLFTNCYANSYRTDRGVICTLSGYPSFPKTSVMKSTIKSQKLPSIASELAKAGYTNTFIYGGDINFTNMNGYLYSTGYHHTIADKDFTAKEQKSHRWGVGDDITFNRLFDVIMQQEKEPWQITLLTLSSHEPWTVPYSRIPDDKIANSFAFTDEQLGLFVNRLKNTDKWDNTLLICIPDHSVVGYPKGIQQTDRERNHIPLLMLGGAIKEPKQIDRLFNQTDLAATLLAQLQLPIDKFWFSRNILSPSYKAYSAYHSYNNGISFIDSTGFTVYDLDSHKILLHEPETGGEERLQKAKAILQKTYSSYENN